MLPHHIFGLGARTVGNAAPHRTGRSGRESGQRRYHEDAALSHQFSRLVIHERGMLNGLNACTQCIFHPAGSMGMGCHRAAVALATSTAAVSSSTVICAWSGEVPGVSTPPEAMSLMTSAPAAN